MAKVLKKIMMSFFMSIAPINSVLYLLLVTVFWIYNKLQLKI